MPRKRATVRPKDAAGMPNAMPTKAYRQSATSTTAELPRINLATFIFGQPRMHRSETTICEQSSGKHGTSRLKQSVVRLYHTWSAKSAANQPSAVSSCSEKVESPVLLRWPG